MVSSLLTTKLFVPAPRPALVARESLMARLNAGLACRLTLVSAPAGYGKTTLLSAWLPRCGRPFAWYAIDEGDSDPRRFLTYFLSALRRMDDRVGEIGLDLLASPQPPPLETILTALLNDLSGLEQECVLVLDDFHTLDSRQVEEALAFLIEHLPPSLHLIIATREDPLLPLARLRARGALSELRAADLCFSNTETADFLNRVMGLELAADAVAALETRTEGWIAGLQLAALAMQGSQSTRKETDLAAFIRSFTGSHHFIMDYLIEEVLKQQDENVQQFLLRTSVLERMCAPLCEAVLDLPRGSAQDILEGLQHANLFIVPLDEERRWFRYHHLFADLLRQRLDQSHPTVKAEIHARASAWYEEEGLEIEAFQEAVAAGDHALAARLAAGKGMPLQFRGAVFPVLNWLKSMPPAVLDAAPALWVMYASALSMTGALDESEEKLRSAEKALDAAGDAEAHPQTRNLIGHIAAIRALIAATHYDTGTIIAQSQRALAYLDPDNLAVRTATVWKLGIAYQMNGERAAAERAYTEAVSMSRTSGNAMIYGSALVGLGAIQESDLRLHEAEQTYRAGLAAIGGHSLPLTGEAHVGLARIHYAWNDLESARRHAAECLAVARWTTSMDTCAVGNMLLARLNIALGETDTAAAHLAEAARFIEIHHFTQQQAALTDLQASLLFHQGKHVEAVRLADEAGTPACRARFRIAAGDPAAALVILAEPLRLALEKGWADERLRLVLLQALALHMQGSRDQAFQALQEGLSLAEAGGCICPFLDEGPHLPRLLREAAAHGTLPPFAEVILNAFVTERGRNEQVLYPQETLPAPLSERELEVLRLVSLGLSNQDIAGRLCIALSTVKGHNRLIFEKLLVRSRTEAVARGRELGLI